MSDDPASEPVTYTHADFIVFARQIRQERMLLYRRIAWVLAALMGATLVLYALLHQPLPWWQVALGLVAAALLWTLASPTVQGKMIEQTAAKTGLLAPHSFTVLPEGFDVRSERGHAQIKWSAVSALELEEGRLLVFVSAVSAYIVPRRAFAGQAEFDAFVAAARDCWRAHHRL